MSPCLYEHAQDVVEQAFSFPYIRCPKSDRCRTTSYNLRLMFHSYLDTPRTGQTQDAEDGDLNLRLERQGVRFEPHLPKQVAVLWRPLLSLFLRP